MGQWYHGNNDQPATFKTVQCFCEGRKARSQEVTVTNPYKPGTPEANAFDRGVQSKANGEPDYKCEHTPPAPFPG